MRCAVRLPQCGDTCLTTHAYTYSPPPTFAVSTGCDSPLQHMNFYAQLDIFLLMPIALTFASMVAFALKFAFDALFMGPNASRRTNYWQGWVVSVLVILFMLHASVSKKAFAVFNCIEYDEGRYVIESDLDLECDMSDAMYAKYYVRGLLGLFFYGFGIPFMAFILLYRIRGRLNDLQVVITFGFMYDGFRARLYWWEVFIMLRKLAILFCAIALNYDAYLQTYCASVLMILYFISHLISAPFETKALNQLEAISLFCSAATFQGSLLFLRREQMGGDVPEWYGPFENAIAVGLVSVNLLFTCTMMACIGLCVKSKLSHKKHHHLSGHARPMGSAIDAAPLPMTATVTKTNSVFEGFFSAAPVASFTMESKGVSGGGPNEGEGGGGGRGGGWSHRSSTLAVSSNPLYVSTKTKATGAAGGGK